MSGDHVDAYCIGAQMAYKDCATMLEKLVRNGSPEVWFLLESLAPVADAMRRKGDAVFAEANSFLHGQRQ